MTVILVIDAVLGRDGDFRFRRGYTTERLHHPVGPAVDRSDTRAVLLDEGGAPVADVALSKDAGTDPPRGPRRYRIRGYTELPDAASVLQVVDEGRLLGEIEIAPEPAVAIDVQVGRERQAIVSIDHSGGPRESWMSVSLFPTEQRATTVYLGRPRANLDVDLSDVHATEVRVGVLFSTGTTSAAAATEPVSLEPAAPTVVLGGRAVEHAMSPWDVSDASVGFVAPFEGALELLAATEWSLDGEVVGRGRLIAIGPLEAGDHRLAARVPGGDLTREVEVIETVRVRPPSGGDD